MGSSKLEEAPLLGEAPLMGRLQYNLVISVISNPSTWSLYKMTTHANKCKTQEMFLSYRVYTRPKKKLLTFSFAIFEMTRGTTGKANMIKVNYTDQKKVTPQFSKKNQAE